MSELAEFFREGRSVLGVFYPLHYMIAVFPDVAKARHAARDLAFNGFPADEAAAFEGKEFVEMESEKTSLWGFFMKAISRSMTSEQNVTDHLIDFAQDGRAFLMVHCPDVASKERAWEIVEKEDPIAAHYYTRGYVDHLKCDFKTAY